MVSSTLALAVMAGGAFLSTPTKVYSEEGVTPASYQLDITPFEVGDQGSLGALCWAYSSSKVLETFVYSNFEPQNTTALNISESWFSLAYMYYVNDFENILVTGGYAKDNTNYQYGQEGIPFFFERVVNTYGIMLEEDFDYTGQITNANYQTVFNEYKSKAKTNIVDDVEFSWIGSDAEIQANYTQQAIVDKIKSIILLDNAVYTGVVGVSGKGSQTPYVWHDTSNELSHALTIIGYDDNKQITIDGVGTKTGAFILLNSYGQDDQIVYMPYDMFETNLQEDGTDVYEMNNVISNTFYISSASQLTQNPTPGGSPGGESGEGGENEGTGNGAGTEGGENEGSSGGENTGTEGDGGSEEGGEVIPEETLSFWESIMAKTTEEKIFMGVAVGIVAIFLFVGIGFLVAAGLRRRQTHSINQQVLAHNFAKYQSHRLNLEKQKKELDEELQKIREEQKRKKQRRLKRQFNKNLNTGGGSSGNNDINI